MNDTKHATTDTLRFDVVTELLQGLEGNKPIAESLISAEKICINEVSNKLIVQAKQRITLLKQKYSQGKMSDDEVKVEISDILLMLT